MALFAEVGRALSYTRASRLSGIPIATLSRRVAGLEKRLGVRLIDRTTRQITLTEPGRRYLERCEAIVQSAQIAHEVLRETAEQPAGHLRVSMPVEFGLLNLAPLIEEFAQLYPRISMDLTLSPRPADFATESIDVSIRLGEISNKSLIARRLGSAVRMLYAAPSYLGKRGVPGHPAELESHDCILQSYMSRPSLWHLVSGKRSANVNVHGRFSTNNVSMTQRLAEQGHGIALLWPPLVRQSLQTGRLCPVLENWSFPPMPVSAVMSSRLAPARVRALIDFLAGKLAV
jgi:DNA-binding transcriptional LysR family regulator